VLLVTPDFPPGIGGIQVLLHRVVGALTRIDPIVVTLSAPDDIAFDRRQPFPVHRIATGALPRSAAIAALNVGAAAAGRRARVDLVLNGHVVTAPVAMALRRSGIPFVQYLYAQEIDHRPRLAHLAVRRARRVLAISTYTADLARRVGAPDAALRIVPPGVDLPGSPAATRAADPTIVTVARLRDAYKGHDVMLAALDRVRAQVPRVRWVVVGDGPLRPGLEAQAAERGLGEHVRFVGAVDDAERDAWLDRGWVFAMPSRVPPGSLSGEGFGIVYVEAGAHGLPVVAGRAGGAVDAVADGVSGLLVDPTDPGAVADALLAVLQDPALAHRMGEAGRARAQALAWPIVARRVEDELLAALASAQP
jgi:phosphatidylinositol alpha-1,6-mannosyltransferase